MFVFKTALFLLLLTCATPFGQEIDLRITGNVRHIPGTYMQHVTTSGNMAYVGAGYLTSNLFLAISVNAEGKAELLNRLPLPLGGSPIQAAIAGSYAYVCSQTLGVQVVDISDPTNLRLLRTYNTPGNSLRATTSDSHLFVADGNGLIILSLADPANPTLAGHLPGLRGDTWDVEIVNNLAYLTSATGYLQIVDVSNPATPVLLGEQLLGGDPDDIEISNGTAFIAGVGSAGNFRAYSLADPRQPQLLGSLPISSSVSAPLKGNRAYVTGRGTGLFAVDISNPASMRILGRLNERQSSPSYTGAAVTADGFICFTDSRDGFTVVEDAPANPASSAKLTRSNLTSATLAGQTIIAQDTFNLYTASIANPAAPVLVATNPLTMSPKRYFVYGDRLALVGSQISVYWLRPDSRTELVAETPSPFSGTVGSPVVNSDVIIFPGITQGLLLTRLTSDHQLEIVGKFQTNDLQFTTAAASGDLAVTTSPMYPWPVYILDISDPAKPRAVHQFSRGAFAAPYLEGKRLYLNNSFKQVEVYDLEDPASPSLLGVFPTRDRYPTLTVQAGIVYAAEFNSGFEIWNVTNPASPLRVGGNSSIHSATMLATTGNLYAVGQEGIFVFENSTGTKGIILTTSQQPSGGITLQFKLPVGAQATIQRTSDFVEWSPVQSITGSGATQEITVETAADAEFFQIELQ